MRIVITEQQLSLIRELHGISEASRSWSNILLDIIKNDKNKQIVVFGNEYPEAYDMFPVDCFAIERTSFTGYDESKSGYREGRYVVYFYVSGVVTPVEINHELKHAFEDYNRISKGKTSLNNTKEAQQYFSGDFTKLMGTKEISGILPLFKKVLYDIYLTSKIEQSAYTDSVFDGWGGPIIMAIKSAIKGDSINSVRNLPKAFVDKEWKTFKEKVKILILDKFDDWESFLSWAEKIIKKRGNIALKKFLKVKYYKSTLDKKGTN